MKQLLISAEANETRAALLEEGRLVELYVERSDRRSYVGNIYRGRVVNVLAGMDAAFVDIGLEKNGFLYVDDIFLPEEQGQRGKKITQLVKPGQSIVVQVVKDPMGVKGARVTTELSIAGRYLVFVPGGRVCGVSRRLPDAERARLRKLCQEIKPEKAGVIIRTAAEGVSEKAITRDLRFLEKLWGTVQRRLELEVSNVVYSEADLAMKIIRDEFTEEIGQVLVDDEALQKRIVGFLQTTTPEMADRVELYQGGRPMFEVYGIETEIKRAVQRRAGLPSGGYLVIDHTEAMTVIDVNSGRYVGRSFLEDTVLRTNLEAAREVVRQLRIRDIGGIIIIDFIDMARRENREQVLATLEAELAKDRTKTYVVELSPLGLVEMTRQNVTDGIRGIMTRPCTVCKGEGVVVSAQSVALEVERRLRVLAKESSSEAFLVEVHPDVAGVFAEAEGARAHRFSEEVSRLFIFEGVDHLEREEMAISAEGSREVISRAALPVVRGQQLTVEITERSVYESRDGIARLGSYVVIVFGAGDLVGRSMSVVVEGVSRNCAYARVAV
ncbi:MAG: Rne/Rng family ribonuclease [Actinobacteria bacterium]|nr:Rne/Rng family ribonuclease [Actinomycetota bacterium]